MKLLYGSQNFGYNKPESDKDWIEFIYPSWTDIISGKMVSREDIQSGIHTKVYDIRRIRGIIIDSHFSQLQFLYSIEKYSCEDLNWFISNRDRICKSHKFNCYIHNANNMLRDLRINPNPKNLTRAYVFKTLLERVLDENSEFEVYVPDSLAFRMESESMSEQERLSLSDRLRQDLIKLESRYEPYRNVVDTELLELADQELIRLLKERLGYD